MEEGVGRKGVGKEKEGGGHNASFGDGLENIMVRPSQFT